MGRKRKLETTAVMGSDEQGTTPAEVVYPTPVGYARERDDPPPSHNDIGTHLTPTPPRIAAAYSASGDVPPRIAVVHSDVETLLDITEPILGDDLRKPAPPIVGGPRGDTGSDSGVEVSLVLSPDLPMALDIIAHPQLTSLQKRFLLEYAKCGIKTVAARRAECTINAIYNAAAKYPVMAEMLKLAERVYDGTLVSEVHRRGVDGVSKPIYQGGRLVGHVQEYSDQLLMFLVKSRMPEFRDRHDFTVAVEDQLQRAADRAGIPIDELRVEVEKWATTMMEAS